MFRATSRLQVVAATIAAGTAIAACGSHSPHSSNSSNSASTITQAQRQQEQQDAVRFSDCMRSHGVPSFPDAPTTADANAGRAFKNALADQSPASRSAHTACDHLLPGGGQSSQSSAPNQAQTVALLALARCMRSHGFSNFPDPSSDGQVTHQMLASAGINLHQPAFVQAADACTSVTHGLLTKARVARFVAGQ